MSSIQNPFSMASLFRLLALVVLLTPLANISLALASDGAGDSHGAENSHAEDGEGAAEHPVWESAEFWAASINFVLLIAFIAYTSRKPANAFFANRRLQIEQDIAEASRIKAEAEDNHEKYKERLASLDSELAELRVEMVAAGKAERDRIIAEAEEKAARMRKDASFAIEQQFKEVRKQLTTEAIEAAVLSAEKMLKEQVGSDDHRRLQERYLNKLAEKSRPRGSA